MTYCCVTVRRSVQSDIVDMMAFDTEAGFDQWAEMIRSFTDPGDLTFDVATGDEKDLSFQTFKKNFEELYEQPVESALGYPFEYIMKETDNEYINDLPEYYRQLIELGLEAYWAKEEKEMLERADEWGIRIGRE